MNFKIVVLAVLGCITVGGCAGLPTPSSTPVVAASQGCGSSPNASVCIGFDDVATRRFGPLFTSSAQAGIDALYSEGFARDLSAFIESHAATGEHSQAWAGADVPTVLALLKRNVDGLTVTTYGGFQGWWANFWWGNTAYDGGDSGPIRLNRAALPRSTGSIANTFVHEAAHRAGLRHPHSDGDFTVALCEPPYVIGSLIQKQIEGASWNPRGHCRLLRP